MKRTDPSIAALLCLIAVALCAPVRAVAQDLGLYEGEVPVTSQDAGERASALPRALAQVFMKLTGDPRAASDPVLSSRLADAQSLLQQYRYRQDVVREGGVPTPKRFLIARFDPAGVDAILAAVGVSVWPEPRPAPLVWLAIDDGRGPRLVSSAQADAVSALTRQARDRGMKLVFPLLDVEDQSRVDATTVRSGDDAALVDAAARYQAGAVLIGAMERSGGSWNANWRVVDQGETLARWTSADPDPSVVLAAGASGAADALAARYASTAVAGEPGEYSVWVVGVGSADDYARVLDFFRTLSIVRRATPQSADGDQLLLRLDLATGLEGLMRLARAGGVLEPVEGANAGAADAVLRVRR